MNAYFDVRWTGTHGIGRFSAELWKRLSGWLPVKLDSRPLDALDPLRLAKYLKDNQAGFFLSPAFNVPFPSSCPLAATIHDLIHVRYPPERTCLKSAYYRYFQRPIVQKSRFVFTVSEYSKSEIVNYYGVVPEQVIVLGNAPSSAFVHAGEPALEFGQFFLAVLNDKPHKNLAGVMQAFSRIDRSTPCRLVLVGVSDSIVRLYAKMFSIPFSRCVVLRGISDEALARLYRGAMCLVSVSLYEGFGLPLVEAMACGCPVVASNLTAHPEILGDSGILIDPQTDDLSESMRSIVKGDLDLSIFAQRGMERVKSYRWDLIVDRLEQVIFPPVKRKPCGNTRRGAA